ncbi:hypothetical protein KP509_39G024600 [Ceratopteris richardii]|uniref:Uncharacterized protein n=1 Tax=Ceratopteris richardii TaxID=49495 RepID=A0A8T2PZJ2_CERRI|nr:hypothetical protein KP509_39G024600 [Ceratopteris richardii]
MEKVAMTGNDCLASENHGLQALLDAFPSAPLDLIASAYVQARADKRLAARIISSSLSGIDLPLRSILDTAPGNEASENECKAHLRGKGFRSIPPSGRSLPLPRLKGPSAPTLIEFFPSSEKNAWLGPLSQRLQSSTSLDPQQKSVDKESQEGFCPEEFPSLEKYSSKGKGDKIPSSGSFHSLRHRGNCRASVAFGLATNWRSSTNRSPLPRVSTKRSKQQVSRAEEPSLWPTEAEACLISTIGDDFNLDIGTVRDVLGRCNGDSVKALMVLQQLNLSLSNNDLINNEVSELGTISQKCSSSFEKLEDDANSMVTVTTNIEDFGVLQKRLPESYNYMENNILNEDNSSMKWAFQSLCGKYPHLDATTLLEVLRVTKFDLNDAEKMLQESGMSEVNLDSQEPRGPSELAKVVLDSLFSTAEETYPDNEKSSGNKVIKQSKETDADLSEIAKWKTVTSADVGSSESDEDPKQVESSNVNQVNRFANGFVRDISGKAAIKGDFDEYERYKTSAEQHWKTMQSYLNGAMAAYAADDIAKAELLTEKSNTYKQLSLEAKEKAIVFLLGMKDAESESDFRLDLRDQHITEALQLLRVHLNSCCSIPCPWIFGVKRL